MTSNVIIRWWPRALGVGILLALTAAASVAQTTTGGVRGVVRDAGGAPVSSATIEARNVELGTTRGATTGENGAYSIPGLRPGRYALTARRIGFGALTDTIAVGIGQTITRDFRMTETTVQLQSVVITEASAGTETRTSEVATNVTEQQINDLPTSDRNFLNLAALAPGITLQNDRIDGTRKTFSAGAQGAEQVNVFIDGATYKNDMLFGGVAGQDASRGSPFPRNAVQEFRILTQNYKAEYQKASSAIITATTKSGGERWSGDAFFNAQSKKWVELDSFQVRDKAASPTTFRKPDYEKYQFGLSAGGPLSDRLRLFGSYEGANQDRTNRVNITAPTGIPALDSVNLNARNGSFNSPFRSSLFFGKLTFLHAPNSTFDLSFNGRHENDIRDFGGSTAFESAKDFKQDIYTGILKHTYVTGDWLNEATSSYQHYNFNPTQKTPGLVARRFEGFPGDARIGGDVTAQDFTQQRLALRDDITYSGFRWSGQHVVKFGANLDFVRYDILKRNAENPMFIYIPSNQYRYPDRVEFQSGDPNFSDNNTQVGFYAQDDWTPVPRLTLNVGLRWDYESKMLNYDYVTPQAIVDSITKYPANLTRPIDPDRYFTDGTQRDPFYGAWQPRLGASYEVDSRGRTTVFGGWGIFYDRNTYDGQALEESFAQQHPSYTIRFSDPGGPAETGKIPFETRFLTEGKAALDELIAGVASNTAEVKLLPNDLKPPVSQQFSLGVRQLVGNWAIEAAYTGVRSKNVFTFYWATFDFTCTPRTFACFTEPRVPGFGTILLGTDNGKTWYDALAVKVDRPYRRIGEIGWGAGLAYTFAKRQTEGFNDNFSFPNEIDYPKQVRNDEPHRVVSNFIVDVPYAWGIQLSGLLTLGSGTRYDRGDRFAPTGLLAGAGEPEKRSFIIPNAWAYRMLDLRLRKDFLRLSNNSVGITLDVFNVFNYQNLGCYSNVVVETDANFGKATCVVSDPRRLQIGTEYRF